MTASVKQCFLSGQALPLRTEHPENQAMLSEAKVIAQKVVYVLEQKKLTPGAVATALGTSRQTVYGWQRTGRITKDNLRKLAEWTGYPLAWWQDPAAEIDGYKPPSASQVSAGDEFLATLVSEIQSRNLSESAKAMLLAAVRSAPVAGASNPPSTKKSAPVESRGRRHKMAS